LSPDTKATAYISLVRPHLGYAAAACLLVIVNSCKRCSIRLLVLLNDTTDQHRCLLSFLNLAGKPSLIVGETVTYHSCTRVFMVWLVFPPHLFVILPSPLVQLTATHFVLSSRTDPYKYSFYPRTIVDWNALPASVSLVLPFIYSVMQYIPA